MFDLSFGEIALLAIVLLVVVGPRELPQLLRAIGRGITKLRTMSWELRSQSGIDEIIRDEGLRKDIEAVRSLSRGRIVDAIVNEAMRPPTRTATRDGDRAPAAPAPTDRPHGGGDESPAPRAEGGAGLAEEPIELTRPNRRAAAGAASPSSPSEDGSA